MCWTYCVHLVGKKKWLNARLHGVASFKIFLFCLPFLTAYRLNTELPSRAYWLHDAPTGWAFNNFAFCPHSVQYLCFMFISKQTAIISLYSTDWLVFITEMKSVYCAVRTGCLNKAVCASCEECIITWCERQQGGPVRRCVLFNSPN